MRALERRDDAFCLGQRLQRVESFRVGDGSVFGATDVVEPRMLGTDAGVVEAGGDRVRLANLPELVLQQVSLVAVQNADGARSDRRRMMRSADAEPGCLDANQLNVR